jgi:hypothetical protein
LNDHSREMVVLFIAGCPRSGTTALVEQLNRDERFAIGRERFRIVRNHVTPEFLAPERLLYPVPSETHILSPEFYRPLRERYRRGTVQVVGDKVPLYTRVLRRLDRRFTDARFVYMTRDLVPVAESFQRRAEDPKERWPAANDYRRAPEFWLNGATAARRFIEEDGGNGRMLILRHEDLYGSHPSDLRLLYQLLGIELTGDLLQSLRRNARAWHRRTDERESALSKEQSEYVERQRCPKLEEWIEARIRLQRRRYGEGEG